MFEAVNAAEVEQALADHTFIHRSTCDCKIPIHSFHKPGEFVEGRLRTCPGHNEADRAQLAHVHYLTATGQQAAVAIRLTRMLWAAIEGRDSEHGQLWGRIVRITYRGSKSTKFGHAQKVYLVEVDKGSITPDYQEVPNERANKRKPRPRRAIRRPADAGPGKE